MAAHHDLIGAMLIGSSARGEPGLESDVDVLLFNATAEPGEGRLIRNWQEWHDGYEVDFNEISATAGLDVERILRDAYWVSGMYEGSILLDPEGRLGGAQRQVRRAFLDPGRLQQRLQPVLHVVRRNIGELRAAVGSGNRPEFCRAMSFALWTVCDALLVRASRSPSRFHGSERLESIVPDEHGAMLRQEGTVEMPPHVAAGHLDWLSSHGVVGCETLAKLRSMAARGRHREALHIAFTFLGGHVKDASRSGDRHKAALAWETASAWLARMGWDAEVLAAKAREVDRFVEHVCRLCGDGNARNFKHSRHRVSGARKAQVRG